MTRREGKNREAQLLITQQYLDLPGTEGQTIKVHTLTLHRIRKDEMGRTDTNKTKDLEK